MKEKVEVSTPVGWLGGYKSIARHAGVSPRTVCRWISEGQLKVRRLSARKILCRPADVDRAVQALCDAYEMEASR